MVDVQGIRKQSHIKQECLLTVNVFTEFYCIYIFHKELFKSLLDSDQSKCIIMYNKFCILNDIPMNFRIQNRSYSFEYERNHDNL